jgi:ABC-type branched-subunit amino acid transport system substrate-binding protein
MLGKRVLGAASFVVALSVACSGSKGGASSGPVEIGMVVSTTGDLGTTGQEYVNIANLAIAEINAGGGVLGGRQLQLFTLDDATVADQSLAAYETLLSRHSSVIHGPIYSGGVVAAADAIRTGNTLTIEGSATSPQITTLDKGGNFFRTVPSDAVQGIVLAQLVVQNAVTSLCVAYRTDSYGTGLSKVLSEHLASATPAVTVTLAPYDPASTDLSQVLQPCEGVRTSPNAGIVFVSFTTDGAALVNDAAKRGWSIKTQKYFMTDGGDDPQILTLVNTPSLVEGIIGTTPSGPDPSTPAGGRARDFQARYQARYGKPTEDSEAANVYDTFYLAAMAIEIAGTSTDTKAIANAMARTSSGPSANVGDWATIRRTIASAGSAAYQGAACNCTFDSATGDLQPPYYVSQWTVANGELTTQSVQTITTAP